MWQGRRSSVIHTYAVYALFGIPRDRWLSCLPLQTTANFEEQDQIQRFLSHHPDPPSQTGDGDFREGEGRVTGR